MSFHLDTLQDTLVEAALTALEPGVPITVIAFARPDDTLLPTQLIIGPDLALPLHLPEAPEPDVSALARATRLKPDQLDVEGGLGGDLLLVTFIAAAERVAAAAHARGLTASLVPAGYQEPEDHDLLDHDAWEVLWEDMRDGLRRLNPAVKQALAEFFFAEEANRTDFLAAVR